MAFHAIFYACQLPFRGQRFLHLKLPGFYWLELVFYSRFSNCAVWSDFSYWWCNLRLMILLLKIFLKLWCFRKCFLIIFKNCLPIFVYTFITWWIKPYNFSVPVLSFTLLFIKVQGYFKITFIYLYVFVSLSVCVCVCVCVCMCVKRRSFGIQSYILGLTIVFVIKVIFTSFQVTL